jgi:hypothetical protein
MRAADRAVLAGLALAGLIAAVWFLVLSPKREEAAKLGDQVSQLQQSVSQQEQLAAAAEQAQDAYGSNYRRLVVFGKAVPEDADTSSLILTLDRIAGNAGVDFRNLELDASGGAGSSTAAAPTTPPPLQSGSEAAAGAQPAETSATTASATAPATEAAAATLPIGATVGPAGLPVMPYRLSFTGDFFRFADLIGGLDNLVSTRGDDLRVDGRLLTVDGFSFSGDPARGFPNLVANFAVTSYLTPASQGLTAGGTPTGPAPTTPAAVPTSSTGAAP